MTTAMHVKTSTGQQHEHKHYNNNKMVGQQKSCHTTINIYKVKTLNTNNTIDKEYTKIINYYTKTQMQNYKKTYQTKEPEAT